jgi:pimeloyl-ACP methyl ester carboxylesterase
VSFDNPDFVDVVIHSYRHRFGYAPGDPALEPIEQALAARPPIRAPTIALHGDDDGVARPPSADTTRLFTDPFELRRIPGAGHNLPQEAPNEVARATLDLLAR